MTLEELVTKHRAGALNIPDTHELRIVIDNDHVSVYGWEEDGDELADPIYLKLDRKMPCDVLLDALVLLGLPAEHV